MSMHFSEVMDVRIISAERERLRNIIAFVIFIGLFVGWLIAASLTRVFDAIEIIQIYSAAIVPVYILLGVYFIHYYRLFYFSFVRQCLKEEIVCRKCDYPVLDIKTAAICSECGADLTRRNAFSLAQPPYPGRRYFGAFAAWVIAALMLFGVVAS